MILDVLFLIVHVVAVAIIVLVVFWWLADSATQLKRIADALEAANRRDSK